MYRLLFSLLIVAAASSQAVTWPQPKRLAIAVNPPANENPAQSGRDAAFTDALARYYTFYFSVLGYRPGLTMTNVDRLAAQKIAADSSCDMLLYLDISAALKEKTILQHLGYRRERFVTTRGLLDIKAKYNLAEIRDTVWTDLAAGSIHEHSDPQWINQLSSSLPGQIIAAAAAIPEPIEYVLQRVVEHTAVDANFRSRRMPLPDTADPLLPIVMLLDKSYAARYRDAWPMVAAQTIAAADNLYATQFGTHLKVAQLAPTLLPLDGRSPIRDLYDALSVQYPARGDTITWVLYDSPNPLSQALGGDPEEIGLSTTGGNLVLIRNLPCEQSRDIRWAAQFTALNFAHELGHRLGAVHVSDPRSLMNHTLSWMAPDQFDQLNQMIIRASLEHRLNLLDTAAYAAFLAESIDTSGYNLADIPAVFFRLLPAEGNTAGPKSRFARVKPVYFFAAQAYGHLIHGELADAAQLFRKAIELAPDQASLHFYLANCTSGAEAKTAWQTAANLGYWQAQITGRKP